MNLRREIHRCEPHGTGVLVRIRFVALDESGADLLTPTGAAIRHEIERVVSEPWKDDDTHEKYVKRVLELPKDAKLREFCVFNGHPLHENALTWTEEADTQITKILQRNGLLKHRFGGIPALNEPKRF